MPEQAKRAPADGYPVLVTVQQAKTDCRGIKAYSKCR